MSRSIRFLAVSLLPLLTGACAITSGNGDAVVSGSQAAGTATAGNDAQAAATTTSALPAKTPAKGGQQQAKLEGPAPETLVGSDMASIQKLVGAPELVRKEKGVEVWQYADNSCTLLMYFYDDKASGARKLTYMEAVTKDAADDPNVTSASCLSSQIAAYKAKPLG